MMSLATAIAGVDRLIAESVPGNDIVLGYMGGEPLLNRPVVHAATQDAENAAVSAARRIRFSITTNATLITPQDAELFAAHHFSVAVSIDGDRARQWPAAPDARRQLPLTIGSSRVLRRWGNGMDARTICRRADREHRGTGALASVLDHVIGLGFDSVGFAAVLTSPDPALAFSAGDFARFLDEMTMCGRIALARLLSWKTYPFSNFETALHEYPSWFAWPLSLRRRRGLSQRRRRGGLGRSPDRLVAVPNPRWATSKRVQTVRAARRILSAAMSTT